MAVVPRRIHDNDYFLVCLQNLVDPDSNTLCEVAFNCMRSFAGISMLVKKRCFVCQNPRASMSTCGCTCFCSKECEENASSFGHQELCRLIRAQSNAIATEDECVQIM